MIAADAALLDLARAGGGDVRGIDDLSLPELKAAEVIVIGPTQAWDRVRAWRVAGVVVGVVVVGGVAPEDRTRLEPVMILARPEPHAFAVARERLAVAELSGQVVLRGAVADLHRSVVRRTASGHPDEAFALLVKAGKSTPALSANWTYVQALLAEAWGLPEVAEERFAALGTGTGAEGLTVFELAARHRASK